jgi:hypothetical protein
MASSSEVPSRLPHHRRRVNAGSMEGPAMTGDNDGALRPASARQRQGATALTHTEWPFAEPRTATVFTLRAVMERASPILLVAHDEEDGAWQFLSGLPMTIDQARMVALHEVYAVDPTLSEIADLPIGWEASREALGGPWSRKRSPTEW